MRKPGEMNKEILAENIRALRGIKEFSQEDLAGICGFHRTYVGSVERCERNVTLSTLEAFASAFEISVRDLLTPGYAKKKKG